MRSRGTVMRLLALVIVALLCALGSATPFSGRCAADLFPASGGVFRQLCLWTDPNVGVLDIPMLIGSPTLGGEYPYIESWGIVPPGLGASYGSQYGVLSSIGPAEYNQSTSCQLVSQPNFVISNVNHTWQPQPSLQAWLNVFPDNSVIMSADGVTCVDTRIYGTECLLLLDALVANLTSGVPPKMIPYDHDTVCSPY